MNRKLLLIGLMPLLLSLFTTGVSAKAVILARDVGKYSSSDTQTIYMPLPPEAYPFTQIRWVSTFSQDTHWTSSMVVDGSQNQHFKMVYISRASVQNEFWFWNEDLQEWIYAGGMSQKLSGVSGQSELIVDPFYETQAGRQLFTSHERFLMEMMDPFTGETTASGYSVVRYMIVKYVNGGLQFQNDWEMRRDF